MSAQILFVSYLESLSLGSLDTGIPHHFDPGLELDLQAAFPQHLTPGSHFQSVSTQNIPSAPQCPMTTMLPPHRPCPLSTFPLLATHLPLLLSPATSLVSYPTVNSLTHSKHSTVRAQLILLTFLQALEMYPAVQTGGSVVETADSEISRKGAHRLGTTGTSQFPIVHIPFVSGKSHFYNSS